METLGGEYVYERERLLPRGSAFRIDHVSVERIHSYIDVVYLRFDASIVPATHKGYKSTAKVKPVQDSRVGRFIWGAGDIELVKQ